MNDPAGNSHHRSDLRLLIVVMSTEAGGTGDAGDRFTTLGTAGNSASSNKRAPTCGVGRGGGAAAAGGVDRSRNGKGDTGMEEPQRGVRGVEILRGDARGDGLGFCSLAADLDALRELFFATTGEIRAVSLRGVNPGVISVSTMDNGEILIGVEKDEGGTEEGTGLGVLRE